MSILGLPDTLTPLQLYTQGRALYHQQTHALRPHAYTYVGAVLALALFSIENELSYVGPCQPDLHQAVGDNDLLYPAVIYSVVGRESLTTLSEGVVSYSTLMRIESRARTTEGGYDAADMLDDLVLHELSAGGRLDDMGGILDDFSIELEVNRIISNLIII